VKQSCAELAPVPIKTKTATGYALAVAGIFSAQASALLPTNLGIAAADCIRLANSIL